MTVLNMKATVVGCGEGHIILKMDSDLLADIPCSEDAQRWAGSHLYEQVDVTMTLTEQTK